MNLEKAYLEPSPLYKPFVPKIEFMFNPTSLTFQHGVQTNQSAGTRDKDTGQSKLSFGSIKAPSIKISDIFFDTYEEREDVSKYIDPFLKAVQFVKVGTNKIKLPVHTQTVPSYKFIWGDKKVYPYHFIIDSLEYKFTMFLPDGTPVRAEIGSLTLKQHQEKKGIGAIVDRVTDGLDKMRSL